MSHAGYNSDRYFKQPSANEYSTRSAFNDMPYDPYSAGAQLNNMPNLSQPPPFSTTNSWNTTAPSR